MAPFFRYLLDTCIFHHNFTTIFSQLALGAHAWFSDPLAIYTTPPPNSNVYIFGRGVVESFGANFDTPVTKTQAVDVEVKGIDGRPHLWHLNSAGSAKTTMRPLHAFGNVQFLGDRHHVDELDVYDTGTRRAVYHYPEFGVYKLIFYRWNSWEGEQDIG